MPNWVFNTITADPEVIQDMRKQDGHATFQKVVPMPEGMNKRGTRPQIMTQDEIDQQWKEYEERKAKGEEKCDFGYPHGVGITQEENDRLLNEYGCTDWYDWAVSFWGCKWDAASDEPCDEGSNEISFRTAWGYPDEFIFELSKKHPSKPIHVFWEEEQGFGEIFEILDGEKSVIEEWSLPEFDQVDEVEDYTISECTRSGGRIDENQPCFTEGKYYLDEDQDMEYDTLEDAKAAAEEMS